MVQITETAGFVHTDCFLELHQDENRTTFTKILLLLQYCGVYNVVDTIPANAFSSSKENIASSIYGVGGHLLPSSCFIRG